MFAPILNMIINENDICGYIWIHKYSIFIDFITTLVGASLGFLFALGIYWLGEADKRKNDKRAEASKAYNTLKRFSLILKSVIDTSTGQATALKEHSEDLRKTPLSYHFLKIHATHDRDRLIESDSLDLFYSFMVFDNTNPNKFQDYKNIFHHSDFLHKHIEDLLLQNEKHINFLHSDLKIIRNNLLKIHIRMSLHRKNIQKLNPKKFEQDTQYIFLEKYRHIYKSLIEGGGFTDFEPFKDMFLIPLEKELFDKLKNQEIADEIAFQMVETFNKMENVKLNTFSLADDFKDVENDTNIKSALIFLKQIHDKIESIVEPT